MSVLPYLRYQAQSQGVNNFLEGKDLIIIADEKTNGYCVLVAKRLLPALQLARQINIPAGDVNKNLEVAEFVYQELLRLNANKQTCIVCIGGGVVSDLGAFVANTFMRGVSLVLVPTTLLAMVDAAIGGKTALNFCGTKNIIGTFYEPQFCYIDTSFLASLPEREIKAGTAEMVKHALIANENIWQKFLNFNDSNEFGTIDFIKTSNEIKSKIVSSDLKDNNARQALNFGHSIAHALEVNQPTQYKFLLHGEAVYLGMLAELSLSEQFLNCDKLLRTQLLSLIQKLNIFDKKLSLDEQLFIESLLRDKKNNSTVRMSLLKNIEHIQLQVAVNIADALAATKLALQDVSTN
jgi:3-dehydroquinate synthase